jgi:tRNA A-37 threonylcarbamoyl transferase component Bud32
MRTGVPFVWPLALDRPALVVALMIPMPSLPAGNPGRARHWWLRVGAGYRHRAFVVANPAAGPSRRAAVSARGPPGCGPWRERGRGGLPRRDQRDQGLSPGLEFRRFAKPTSGCYMGECALDRPMPDTVLDESLRKALTGPPRRVQRLDLADGRRFWLKRVERLQGRLRLQKGDPARAFAAEREGLRALEAAGLPVAGVAREGLDWVLMPDAGPTLPDVVADPARSDVDRLRAFAEAGRALGRLHWAGMAHGRPAVRDVCWDGREARFIDLERFRHARRAGFWQAADVVTFAQTAFTLWPDEPQWLDAALAAYALSAPEGAMASARRLAGGLRPLGWLAAGLAMLKPGSRELRAVGLTLARLRR